MSAADSLLTRLPSVLVHLVMQQLQIEELARLACTCTLMRADSLHPSAGRYLAALHSGHVFLESSVSASEYFSAFGQFSNHEPHPERTNSPLGRAHLSVTLHAGFGALRHLFPVHLRELSHSQLIAALAEKAADFAHIHTLDLAGASDWPELDAVAFLQTPALQRVRTVTHCGSIWMVESVQLALCRLPLLSTLIVHLHSASHPSLRLHPSAFAEATALRSLVIETAQSGPTLHLAGLVTVPHLTALEVRDNDFDAQLVPWLTRHCRSMLRQLRVLTLTHFSPDAISSQDLRDFFRSLPALRYLYTSKWHPGLVLHGLMDAGGAAALPELRVVRFFQDQSYHAQYDGTLSPRVLRRFLAAFPLVRYCLSVRGEEGDPMWMEARFEEWPRVCTVDRHREPDVEGHAEECEGHVTSVCGEDEDEHDDDDDEADEEEREDNQNDLPPALADDANWKPLSTAESLQIIDVAYAKALARKGPWNPHALR